MVQRKYIPRHRRQTGTDMARLEELLREKPLTLAEMALIIYNDDGPYYRERITQCLSQMRRRHGLTIEKTSTYHIPN